MTRKKAVPFEATIEREVSPLKSAMYPVTLMRVNGDTLALLCKTYLDWI